MAEETKDLILGQIKREMLIKSIKNTGKRLDGRDLDEFRPISIQKDVIKTAEGSAIAKIGKTQVLAGVKFTMEKPFADRPEDGIVIMSAELLPIAHSSFESGPPDEHAVELARVVDRGIRSAECIDVKKMFVEDGKVLGIFVDLFVLDHDGNYIDTAALAAIAALENTRVPKVEDGKLIRGEYSGKLPLSHLPVSVTSIKTGGNWIVDPAREEELTQNGRLSVAVTENHVCSLQKARGSLTQAELVERLEFALKTGKSLRKLVQS